LIVRWIEAVAAPFVSLVDHRDGISNLWTSGALAPTITAQPVALIACAHVSEIATRLAPEFVRSRYSIRVEPPIGGDPKATVRILLATKDGRDLFQLKDVADGLRLWVEIAVLEAADAMRRVELRLRRALYAIEQEVDGRYYDLADGIRGDPEERLMPSMNAYLRLLNSALMTALDPTGDTALALSVDFAAGRETADWMPSFRDFLDRQSKKGARLAAARPRLYLIDEPERHLNPRLQRAAASWLVDLVSTRGSQAVVATHSPAFLNIGANSHFVEVRRPPAGHSQLRPFLPADLTAYSELAVEVGLDRGELLGSCKVLLFVEGRHDQAVLEELFGRRFHRAGIVVVPLMGAGRHLQIVEHEVLIRITRAVLAVVFDKLSEDTIWRLLNDPVFREDSLSSNSTELQAMASLLKNADKNERLVQPLSLPLDDIFDAIHEDVIRDQFSAYPGHEAARAAYGALPKGSPNRKKFYESAYGIPDRVATYTQLGSLMRDLNLVSTELLALASEAERLAFSAE
jgi:hypothetical protein